MSERRTHWYPLYAYVRRLGNDEDVAKDLTQAFFARLLEKNYLGQVDRSEGEIPLFPPRRFEALPGR